MASYRLTPAAKQDLKNTWLIIDEGKGRRQATQFNNQIEQAVDAIVENPKTGQLRYEVRVGYRSMKVGCYVLFYRQKGHWIEIVRILHRQNGHLADLAQVLQDKMDPLRSLITAQYEAPLSSEKESE